MTTITSREIRLKQRPTGLPSPENFELVTVTLPKPSPGEMAVRNLYGEVQNVFAKDLSFWAGSRMVRGDDIYLLDYWALDNLNLYGPGGGAGVKAGEDLDGEGSARGGQLFFCLHGKFLGL